MAKGIGIFRKVELKGANSFTMLHSPQVFIEDGKMILKGHDFLVIPKDLELAALAYMEDGIVPFRCKVLISTNSQLNLEILGADAKIDRRDSLKVPVNIREDVLSMKSTGKNEKSIKVNDEIQLLNLSMGGIGFMSNKPYFKNQRILINISGIREDFEIIAQVLRKVRLDPGREYKYSYGCRFINNSEEKSRMLCEYVFNVQIQRSKMQDLD